MTKPGKPVRAVGHPLVAGLASAEYKSIASSEDMTPGEQAGAAVATAILQLLGHVAVEAAASWLDDHE